jgi:hypothetical protein
MHKWAALAALPVFAGGCKDIDRFATQNGDYYCGRIVDAPFVRRGFDGTEVMRLTLDTAHLNDSPGTLSTSDRLLMSSPLRPLPELSNDPLWTLSFGEGREKNLIFGIDPVDPARGPTIMAIVSLMHSGDAEVRLVRGAPALPGGADAGNDGPPLFGVFAPLTRKDPDSPRAPECSF